MRWMLLLALVLAGCTDSPTRIDSPAPPGTEEGRLIVAQSGCLACHRLGDNGTDGPGPELTKVGARMSRRQMHRVLLRPKAPMPSYEGLSRSKREAVVDYLAALR